MNVKFEAHVGALWRYPVKSMAGETLQEAQITERGLLGDRVYALVDERNKVGTAKKLAQLLNCFVRFASPPRHDDPHAPAVTITLPDGRIVTSTQSDAADILSEFAGRKVSLRDVPPDGLALEFAAGTLEGIHASTTELPLAAGAPPGTFVDYSTVHVLASSSLRELSEAYPTGRFDVRRFRPNVVVETTESGFVENGWLGRTLALGDEARLRVTVPKTRCVVPTLPQQDLPRDPRILRTIAEHNRHDLGDFGTLPCVGVSADVLQPGLVRVSDVVHLMD